MRKVMILLLFMVISPLLKAQTFDEWFRQKTTQRKYLLEQIAALKLYSGYLQKGYSIAKGGLYTIQCIKDGDLDLHSDYFLSLKTVNPNVKKYPLVRIIVEMQMQITRIVARSRKLIKNSDAFTAGEREYQYRVYDRLLQDCEVTIDELETVTTNAALQMKDDERIKKIDKLYAATQAQWAFARSFSNEAALFSAARKQEQRSIKDSRLLHGIKE